MRSRHRDRWQRISFYSVLFRLSRGKKRGREPDPIPILRLTCPAAMLLSG